MELGGKNPAIIMDSANLDAVWPIISNKVSAAARERSLSLGRGLKLRCVLQEKFEQLNVLLPGTRLAR